MNKAKIKVLCDYTEQIAKADGLELLGLIWDKKENKGQFMLNFPEKDDKRLHFLMSVMIAMIFIANEDKNIPQEEVDREMMALISNAKLISKNLKV